MEPIPKHSKSKRNKTALSNPQNKTLLPGLPNHIAERCLSSLPPRVLYSVCHSWRRLLYSPSFPPFFSLYTLLFPSYNNNFNMIQFLTFDPLSSTWESLPSPPQDPPLRLLHRHPSFLSRNLPIQSLTVSNNLVLVAATDHQFIPALHKPLVFNPESSKWFFGPQFSTPRRWCATGSVSGAVYVASGVGSCYQRDTAKLMEQWDLSNKNWGWEKKAGLKDGKFSREAVEAVGYKGKLYMVNVKGNAVKEGIMYEVESNTWKEMPEGMLAGWNGAVASMDEDVMYVVDEVKGVLRKYDMEKDCWGTVIELPELIGTQQIAAARGRVCAVCGGRERIVVVDVVSRPVRVWTVDPPPGFQVVSLHILPRMSRQD